MTEKDIHFVIPTYRLRDVGETVEAYDENFRKSGHSVPITVFDDSYKTSYEKYYQKLEQVKTTNDLFYVGPQEKEEFIKYLCKRLRNQKLDSVVRNLFRPSYGGNRNFTLMYTLGGLMVSTDDDMRPYGLIEDSPEALDDDEISRGKLIPLGQNGYTKKSFDIMQAFMDVLGRPAGDVPNNYSLGELLNDTSMDLETNTSIGFHRENSLLLKEGKVGRQSIIKIAQTFRTGTNDIDAADFISMFLEDDSRSDIETLNDHYILVNFRPCITTLNWRMDCGVAGYDNTTGLPPFFPTRLRFEDYIYRLWIQNSSFSAAHVDSVQTHIKNNYMREPMASELLNESICTLLKRKIRSSLRKIDDWGIIFDYDGSITFDDSEEILNSAQELHSRILASVDRARSDDRKRGLQAFAQSIERTFYDFEPDFFRQNVSRIIDDEIGLIRSSLELWPTLLEIVYFRKKCHDLPIRRVRPCTSVSVPRKVADISKSAAKRSERAVQV
ncbi:hypothetical protein OQ252_12760 [Acetobacter farinalis]|uniref:Uncharacterized protein n=1 Tax=Acetobacter farinalis TaxID=1260984 RepID=A0ABT3QAE3_9PROT|nr:hypothetical protein [Acetobacter farinalis]MCX2562258.1 hypothetical protein [Acetobacter farinalis]